MHEDGLPLIRNPKGPEEWRVNREVRFTWRQQREREWIPFREIAEWFAELNGGGANEAARASAYEMLQHDFLNGDFEEAGRSRILYLHFRTPMAKMTRNRLQTAIDTLSDEDVRLEYLGRCWLPEPMFQRWLAKHELPLSPPRFEPRKGETKIETPPPGRKPGQKPHVRNAVGAYVAKLYPDGVPANVTTKMIAQNFESSRGGFRVSPRTVSRALGRR